MFAELAVSKCRNLKCLKLTTNKDERRESEQSKGLTQLAENLKTHNVIFIVDYTENLHDRQIL